MVDDTWRPAVSQSIVRLPANVGDEFDVYVNGVPQREWEDYEIRGGALVFDRELRHDRISRRRWALGLWGVGTYRQDDTVDVRYEVDGAPRLAHALRIESEDS